MNADGFQSPCTGDSQQITCAAGINSKICLCREPPQGLSMTGCRSLHRWKCSVMGARERQDGSMSNLQLWVFIVVRCVQCQRQAVVVERLSPGGYSACHSQQPQSSAI